MACLPKQPKMLHISYAPKGTQAVTVTARANNGRIAHKVVVPDGNDKFREEAMNTTDGKWWPLNPACMDDYPEKGWTLKVTDRTRTCKWCFGYAGTIGEDRAARRYRNALESMIVGFEFENCTECGKDLNEHTIVPFLGLPFMRCHTEGGEHA